jgi:hypothetical protein
MFYEGRVSVNFIFTAIYEAVTGLSALLATSPRYLQQLGLLASKPSQQGLSKYSKASLLLLVALHTLPKLPYYLAADQWRLEVLSSNMTNITELSNSWRRYRCVAQKRNQSDLLPFQFRLQGQYIM